LIASTSREKELARLVAEQRRDRSTNRVSSKSRSLDAPVRGEGGRALHEGVSAPEQPDERERDEEEERGELAKHERRWRWEAVSAEDRWTLLGKAAAKLFAKRFGVAWSQRHLEVMRGILAGNWPPRRKVGAQKRSREFDERSRLVSLLEYENALALPRRKDGGARFLSITEFAWIVIMVCKAPRSIGRQADPMAVLRAERENVRKILYGNRKQAGVAQRPAEVLGVKRIRRGQQRGS
jgi:hypothetical protein